MGLRRLNPHFFRRSDITDWRRWRGNLFIRCIWTNALRNSNWWIFTLTSRQLLVSLSGGQCSLEYRKLENTLCPYTPSFLLTIVEIVCVVAQKVKLLFHQRKVTRGNSNF